MDDTIYIGPVLSVAPHMDVNVETIVCSNGHNHSGGGFCNVCGNKLIHSKKTERINISPETVNLDGHFDMYDAYPGVWVIPGWNQDANWANGHTNYLIDPIAIQEITMKFKCNHVVANALHVLQNKFGNCARVEYRVIRLTSD